jgi:WD40 repeat protein
MSDVQNDEHESAPLTSEKVRRRASLGQYVLVSVAVILVILGIRSLIVSPLRLTQTFEHTWADSLAWSPDSTLLAVAGRYMAIYDVASGNQLLRYDDPVSALAWSPDGSLLAAGVDDGEIIIWDVSRIVEEAELIPRQRLVGHSEAVRDLTWSPDSLLLASIIGGDEDPVIVWDVSAGQSVWRYKDAFLGYGLAWSPDGSMLAAESVGSIVLLDMQERAWIDTIPHTNLPASTGIINDFDWSPDNQQIVLGYWGWGVSGGMAILDVASGVPVTSFSTRKMVDVVDWSPTRDRIVLGINYQFLIWSYGRLYLYDTHLARRRWLSRRTYSMDALEWSPDGSMLAVTSFQADKVTIWRIKG